LIVIDDGSSDKTPEIISRYQDSRIKIIKNKENLGFVKSLNKAINYAKGEYIARIDDDDFWSDLKKLEKQVEFLENNPEYVLVGCGVIKANKQGKEVRKYLFPEKDEEIREIMLIANPFAHTGVVFKRKAWEAVGGYDEKLYFSQDSDLWAKLGKIGKLYNIREYSVCVLDDSQNRTKKRVHYHLLLKQKIRLRHRKDYPHFLKAYLIGWGAYLFSFMPFRKKLDPLYLKLRSFFLRK
jgi:glycosyltransferase involved in cell wall biosynthesis